MRIVPEMGVPISTAPFDPNDLSVLDRAKLACNTINLLFPDNPNPENLTEEELNTSREAFSALTGVTPTAPPSLPALAHYPTASLKHLDALLSEYDVELVNSAVRIREYVKNKLIEESENPDGKIRIRALELLGKVKDVGLFSDRVEITHKNKSDEELEAELKQKLDTYLGSLRVIEGEKTAELDENENEEVTDELQTPAHTPVEAFIDTLIPTDPQE